MTSSTIQPDGSQFSGRNPKIRRPGKPENLKINKNKNAIKYVKN